MYRPPTGTCSFMNLLPHWTIIINRIVMIFYFMGLSKFIPHGTKKAFTRHISDMLSPRNLTQNVKATPVSCDTLSLVIMRKSDAHPPLQRTMVTRPVFLTILLCTSDSVRPFLSIQGIQAPGTGW